MFDVLGNGSFAHSHLFRGEGKFFGGFMYHEPLFDFIFFLLLQKRSPPIDYSPIGGNSYVQRLYYCDFSICNSTLRFIKFTKA